MIRILAISLSLLLAGCSLGGGSAPSDHFYRLPEIVQPPVDKPLFKHIVIKPVRSSGLLHDRAVLYVEQDRPLELQRYHYHYWSEAPAYLVHNALLQAFTSRSIAGLVSREMDERRPELVVESQLIRFERYLSDDAVKASIELQVSVRNLVSPEKSWSRSYQASEPAQAEDFHASAAAFGLAMQGISLQILEDLHRQ